MRARLPLVGRPILSGPLRTATTLLALLTFASAAVAADVVKYYHLDGLGNVRAITDQNKVVVERHDYLPFGEECLTGPCAANPGAGAGQPRKFTGKERDAETGLDYFGARYYRANTGRFTTVDPVYNWNANLLDPQRWNRYAYGRNNPLRYVDPNGEDVFDLVGGTINAFGSNLVLGAGRADPYNSDYALGQSIGDVAGQVPNRV
jgi:RHS repeat-associated protein